ncbi:hypothetical protein [Embleya scabrispora]|uniref:hypothetical protein n=1 Tax=Embleya scabrispora TaxID=159449 RepID=UPI00131A0497|nr:hypothetical protein [Embleya scabrispora]MYS85290.1 hypothetical protein [Streptomyces sp. SID5474]
MGSSVLTAACPRTGVLREEGNRRLTTLRRADPDEHFPGLPDAIVRAYDRQAGEHG